MAALSDLPRLAARLLALGALPDAIDRDGTCTRPKPRLLSDRVPVCVCAHHAGFTALHYAVTWEAIDTIKVLLKVLACMREGQLLCTLTHTHTHTILAALR
jgi:hypothetical protein